MDDVKFARSGWAACAQTLLAAVAIAGCSILEPPAPAAKVGRARGAESGFRQALRVDAAVDAGDELLANPSLTAYLRYAALHNSELRASYHEWMAALQRVPQLESLPDPRITYAYYFNEVETRVGAQRHRLGVSQTFPWVGKRALRGDIAAIEAEEKRAAFDAAKLRVFRAVTDAFTEYYYLGRAIEITRENVELLAFTERLAQARYRVTSGGYSDLVRAQIELAGLTDRLESLEGLRAPVMARLNTALGRRSAAPLPWPRELPRSRLEELPGGDASELVEGNPELVSIAAASRRHHRAAELAGKNRFPDVTLGVQWIETAERSGVDVAGNGRDAVLGLVSFNLPLWGETYGAAVREAQSRAEAASRRFGDLRGRLASELTLALYEVRDAERRADLYAGGLIVKAEESLAATLAGYESGESSFLDVVDAQRALLDFKLAHARALADREQHLARGEMIAGRSLRADQASSGIEEVRQ